MNVYLHRSIEDSNQYVIDGDESLPDHLKITVMTPDEVRGFYRALKSYVSQLPIPVIPDLDKESDEALAGAYIILRDRKAAKNREAKVTEKNISDAMDRITNEFLTRFEARGSTSIGIAGVGTVSRGKDIKVASTDWKTHYNYQLDRAWAIKEAGGDPTEIFSALHKRLSLEPIEAYMDKHDGQPPPGIEVKTEYKISVRKANSKGEESYE